MMETAAAIEDVYRASLHDRQSAGNITITVMHITKTLHPPGGATALIAVVGGDNIHQLGYIYALVPAGPGPLILLIVGLIVNNIPAKRRYPEFWW